MVLTYPRGSGGWHATTGVRYCAWERSGVAGGGASATKWKVAKIGFIEAGSQQANQIFLDYFRTGLTALGWSVPQGHGSPRVGWSESRHVRSNV
jgi:hypothetical protein